MRIARKYILFAVIVFIFLNLQQAHAKNIFRRTPKVQVYNSTKKEFVFRDKVQKFDIQWKETLPPEVFAITRKKGTEMPFSGKYWNNHERGLYSCACCGIDLFMSDAKFDYGDGWPSFFKPVADSNVILKNERGRKENAIEVLCVRCDAHLGYLLRDDPASTVKRYSINSSALIFKKAQE